ncbi:hypothetical protein ID866_1176 [Astraeus odoratus]|nr:hypothetical protein ID866_1176 [Astraeus odoratus]
MATLSDTEEVFDTRLNTLRMSEQDLQQTARFTREFVVMNLVPWMERCVIEWNEAYSSSRRLPSRLFSSTRRLFGSGTSTPQTPVHGSSTSISSLPTRSHTYSASQTSSSGPNIPPPSQQRRLAEFATILGDFKLAVGIWESLRKEGKGGSDVLPMLLSASPAITSHVTQALSSIHPSASELPPQAQLQALRYSVRWETSIVPSDFISDVLEGERWLVWAAGNAEEAPSALLLAYAALLSVRKEARRRAALWYFFSASKLQKCGIKPLAMYFLRRAHEILNARSEKLLSPSFWDSEGNTPSWQAAFGAAISGIEHPLGRLLYSTGDTRGAIQLFLALLRWSSTHSSGMNDEVGDGQDSIGTTKVYLEDFMAALSHLTSMSDEGAHLSDLTLPIKFSLPASSRLQLRRDPIGGEESEWERKEEVWRSFWMGRGRETLEKSGKAVVGESFWFSLTLHNPLDTEVTLANVSLAVEAKGFDRDSLSKIVQVECLDKVTLFPNENRVVSFTLKPFEAATLNITHLRYEFLGLLPAKESLARRGRRMQDTLQQRLTATYAPDILSKVEVEDANLELDVSFETNEPLTVLDGESKQVKVWISNAGSKAIGEVWMLAGSGDQISLDNVADEVPRGLAKDIHTDNRLLQWSPYCLPLDQELHSSDTTEVLFTWRPISTSNGRLCLLFIYRETGGRTFHSRSHPHIPTSLHSKIFPLYNPLSLDILVFWETPSEQRRGFMLIPPITLGATHGALRDIVQGIEQTKAKRSMYAETQREKTDILQAIRDSEWNAECNPLVVTVEDGLIVEHDFNKGYHARYLSSAVPFLTRNWQGLLRSCRIYYQELFVDASFALCAEIRPKSFTRCYG